MTSQQTTLTLRTRLSWHRILPTRVPFSQTKVSATRMCRPQNGIQIHLTSGYSPQGLLQEKTNLPKAARPFGYRTQITYIVQKAYDNNISYIFRVTRLILHSRRPPTCPRSKSPLFILKNLQSRKARNYEGYLLEVRTGQFASFAIYWNRKYAKCASHNIGFVNRARLYDQSTGN